ncbi:MAG: phage terminase large subunit [Candidatus Kapaibacterium sp.]
MKKSSLHKNQHTISPAWCAWTNSAYDYKYPPHIRLIDEHLVRCANREITRLVVNIPPRHGKSELISRFFPYWYLGNFPDHRVILTSYEAGFAASWGRRVRNMIAKCGPDQFGIALDPSSRAAAEFNLDGREGGMICSGAGGSITGRGADLLIIDDPVKNDAEAMSATYRNAVWEWFASTAYTRLAPGGIVVIVMTRWHEDDLCGRIAAMKNQEWKWLRLPAIAQAGDPLGRNPGDALWPGRFGADKLCEIRATIGQFWFSALYQQQPAPASGGIFKRKFFRYYRSNQDHYILNNENGEERIPRDMLSIMAVADLAATLKQTSDYTVVIIFGLTSSRKILVLDVVRERFEGADHLNLLKNINLRWRPAMIGIESSQYQISLVQSALREGLPVLELRPDADKVTRALPMAARMESGGVYFPAEAPWLADFETELLNFPKGSHDDQVDAFAYIARMIGNVSGAMPVGVSSIKSNDFSDMKIRNKFGR